MSDRNGDSGAGSSSTCSPRAELCKTSAAVLFTLSVGLAVTHAATDGFQAYTLESARRIAALRSPSPIPDQALEFSDGHRARLMDNQAAVLLVDFIYTRCETYCVALGSMNSRLQSELALEIGASIVRLVSVSFDPARDGPAELVAYRERHSRDPAGWDLGRPLTPAGLQALLSAFGVVVIPDERGGFAHNAAVHVVGPDRRLVAIHGLDDIEGVVGTVRRIVAGDVAHAAIR